MKYKVIFLTGFCALVACIARAQTAAAGICKIKGRVLDSVSRQQIGYATVTAFQSGHTTVAGGIITDEKGQFLIEGLDTGSYLVKVDYIGYTPKSLTGIVLSEKKPLHNVGDILIASSSKVLKDVTVTAARNFMENHIDKLVYNVEKDVSSQGGVATDVLKKIPMVSVDIDGNIDLLGDTNVRVFINGKPSAMFDNNLAEALKAIPANQIKSIEVITSPGAQYDAQGTGGIINIILKDNKARGVNGNCSVNGGSRYENGSVNVHAKNGNLDLNASVSGNMQLDTKTLTSLNRTGAGDTLIQNGYGAVQRNGYRLQTGFDEAFTKKDDLNGAIAYNNFGNTNQGSLSQYSGDGLSDISELNNSNNYFRYRSEDWNLNYKKKFDRDGQELNISYQGASARSTFLYRQDQRIASIDSILSGARGNNGFRDVENYISIDYAYPFTTDVVLNTGVKGSFSRIKSTADQYTLIPEPDTFSTVPFMSDPFNFNRDIYAAYVTLSFPINKHYDMKMGVRNEYTLNSSPGDTIRIPSDDFVTPSLTLSRKLDKGQTLKLNYSRRIQRPGYGQYNPFVNATDPNNLFMGNPGLLPQKIHSTDLSYYKFFDKGSNILVTLFYRYSQFDWQGYFRFYNTFQVGDTTYNNVTVNQTLNAGTQQSGGVNISGSWVQSDKLQIRPSVSFFEKYIQSSLLANSSPSSFNYRGNINITWQPVHSWTIEGYGGYYSIRYEVQGKYPSFANYSLSVRKQLWDKKGTLVFSTTDPFSKYVNQVTYITGPNLSAVSERRYPIRFFSLSFSYKFGKIQYQETKEEEEKKDDTEGAPQAGN